jgi:GntR family transcriptional regulator/MocR family aminotransferase
MFLPIDRDSPVPLARQIASYLEGLIRHGHLEPGSRLPATRTLASGLGVSKDTVDAAYDELAARRLVRTAAGRWVSVRRRIPDSPELDLPFRARRGRDPLPHRAWLEPEPPAPLPIDLAGETPPLLTISSRQIRRFHEEALATSRGVLFSPPPPLGETSLRAAAGRHLARCGVLRSSEDVVVRPTRAAVVRDLLSLFVPSRGTVLADSLLDPELALPIRERGARVALLPADVEPKSLAGRARRAKARLLLVASGASRLPGKPPGRVRRRALLDLAREEGLPIVEDVTGIDWLAEPPIPPPLAALDPTGRVFSLCDLGDEVGGEFGAAVFVAPPKALDRLRRRAGPEAFPGADRLSQRVLARALDAPGRMRTRRALLERRKLLSPTIARSLRRRLPALEGHAFSIGADAVRLDLPGDVRATDLAEAARAKGVRIRTARDCGGPPSRDRFLLLDLTRHEEGELLEGIRLLGAAFDDMLQST